MTSGLPTPFTSFVGRRTEMAELRRLVGAARLVTLSGAGGVGKTRLALEAAAASVKEFPGGVWLVDLAPVQDPVAVPGAVAAALGMPDQGPRPVLEQLVVYLSSRRVLLVLDNCEHLVDACAQLAQRLLSSAAELRILATSREPLGLTGEHVFPVPPLDQADAAELLRDRTAGVRPGFEVNDANRAAVRRLCEGLDGLPLAIELAASRLRTFSVEQVAERLEDRFTLLTAGSRTARPHQRTLRAAIDWSWELCSPAERLLWGRLSVFAGTFTLDAVEDVCAGDGIVAGEVMDLLDRLVAQSLVEHADAGDVPRFRLLESIRHYGRERLVDSGEDERLLRGHRDFFLALAGSLHQDWFGPRQAEILARFRAEHGNLLAALEYRSGTRAPVSAPRTAAGPGPQPGTTERSGSRPGDPQAALALAAALMYHWVAGGFLGEGRRQLERALAAAPEPTLVRARALATAAYVAQLQYDLAVADRWLEEAQELTERLGDRVASAHVRGHCGVSALYRGQREEAFLHLEQAVATHTALGDQLGVVSWRGALAIAQTLFGDPRAPETSRQALADQEAHGERYARAHLLMVLGRHAWALGRHTEAKDLTLSALSMLRGFSDPIGVAKMVEQLAWITASEGDHRRAGRLLGAAGSLLHDAGTTIAAGDPQIEEYHARCEAEILQSLGSAGYEQALADGAAVSGPAQAIAYALDTETDADTRTGTEPAAPPPVASPLTRREQQVAALVARGMTNRRIAAELVLSPRTVDGHVDHILTKLDFSCRAQIAAWWAANQVPTP
ncbi:LuxR C-terminal-related transcriptional regulator [Streptomyces guryensis]|uniref:LuxR C-terminal-related transcriptional regulator n=1 Tax=Streptomyces guryensis TaxID=2886947 RepID=A0A9Q3ZES2_9ACTN|nr:LuxR C-terminal-related transcriptional regulator [Streptomyces guryensis]MCD9879720.1 LuxR C-terminal-related transcriptional regulator [Streptomyces guryensis]